MTPLKFLSILLLLTGNISMADDPKVVPAIYCPDTDSGPVWNKETKKWECPKPSKQIDMVPVSSDFSTSGNIALLSVGKPNQVLKYDKEKNSWKWEECKCGK